MLLSQPRQGARWWRGERRWRVVLLTGAVPGEAEQHLGAVVIDSDAARGFVYRQDLNRPLPLAKSQDTRYLFGRLRRLGGELHFQQRAFVLEDGGDTDQRDPGQWRRWRAGALGYQRPQAEDIPGDDARVGMP